MKKVIMKGKTVDDAVNSALQVLAISKEAADIRVLSEGKGAMLGLFGGEEAEVEVWEKLSTDELARVILQDILDRMGFTAIAKLNGIEEERVLLEVKGEDISRIIGKDGATLNALQLVVSTLASRSHKDKVRVTIDAEGYRQRRQNAIERLAQETIDDVLRLGIEKMLPPMNPADRRVVHMLVQRNPKLASFSVGERGERRVVIAPAEKAPKDATLAGKEDEGFGV